MSYEVVSFLMSSGVKPEYRGSRVMDRSQHILVDRAKFMIILPKKRLK